MPNAFQFTLNGKQVNVETDDSRPLLDVIREEFGLTGTKYGCGEGECGCCSVMIDGEVTRSCITSVSDAADTEITTIEGLSNDDKLHPVQQAFIDKHAMQCGYCVPGQIVCAVGLLKDNPNPSNEEIVEGMSGNICRCCNYPNILAAVAAAAKTNGEDE